MVRGRARLDQYLHSPCAGRTVGLPLQDPCSPRGDRGAIARPKLARKGRHGPFLTRRLRRCPALLRKSPPSSCDVAPPCNKAIILLSIFRSRGPTEDRFFEGEHDANERVGVVRSHAMLLHSIGRSALLQRLLSDACRREKSGPSRRGRSNRTFTASDGRMRLRSFGMPIV